MTHAATVRVTEAYGRPHVPVQERGSHIIYTVDIDPLHVALLKAWPVRACANFINENTVVYIHDRQARKKRRVTV
jgi:hypothetical protein